MAAEVPQTLEYRGGQLNATPMIEQPEGQPVYLSSERLAFVILIDLEHFGLCYLETSFILRGNLDCRGMGGQVGRGARRTIEPVWRNNETIGELDVQGNDRGVEANGGVGGVPVFFTIVAQQLQNLLPTLLA
ncbi:hypothetical protein Tco_0814076 [Tanacetum coccineum]